MRSIRDPAGILYQTLLTKKGFDLSGQAAVYFFRRSFKPKAFRTQRASSLLERWLSALMYSSAGRRTRGNRFAGIFQTKILLLSFSAAMRNIFGITSMHRLQADWNLLVPVRDTGQGRVYPEKKFKWPRERFS